MKVFLAGWQSAGLRCPDMDIQIPVARRGQVNLVQMPNGTGKSTIIDLITAALSQRKFDAREILSLRSQDAPQASGEFWVKIAVESDSDRRNEFKFGLKFDFQEKTFQRWTLRNRQTGIEQGFFPPTEIETFLNQKCVDVFVFKGDKAESLLDAASADAEDAIKAFYGLSSIEELVTTIDMEFDNRPVEGGTTSRTLTKRKNRIAEWATQLNKLRQQARDTDAKLSELRAKLPGVQKAYQDILSKNSDFESRRERYDLEKANCVRDVSNSAISAFELVKNPFVLPGQFGALIRNLKGSFDTLKLPGTSLEFFNELAEAAVCVCGRSLDQASRVALIANAKTYLSDEHVTVVNGMKKDITEYDGLADSGTAVECFSRLENAITSYERKKGQLARLEISVKESASAEDQIIIDEHNKLLGDISEAEVFLQRINTPAEGRIETIMRTNTPELVDSIPSIDSVIRALKIELAEQEGVVADYEAKEVLKEVLSQAIQSALPKLANELAEMTNSKLVKILPAGTSLKVSKIGKCIQLSTGKTDEVGDKEKGSGGENVAIAYSFASSVIEKSGVKFPLIVDHPVTALMSPARAVVGKILAKIGHQFTGFVIDTEREAFVEAIEGSGCEVNYFTIYRDIEGNKTLSAMLPKNEKLIQRTRNGIVCTDKQFFSTFQKQDRGQ